MSILKTTGILIKTRKYLEKDKIVTFFTEDFGKIAVRCKGARDPFNHWGHNTEPPNVCWLQLYERNGFYLTTEIKPIFNLFGITQDFKRLIAFEAFAQILEHFQEGSPYSRSFFGLCIAYLQSLNREDTDPVYLSYAFVFDYLKWQGLPILTDHCIFCGELLVPNQEGYSLSYEEGGIVCSSCAREKSFFNPVSSSLILLLQNFHDNRMEESEKRIKVFFQNWEDLDRIVKDYYKCRFNKKLQTYLSLRKM